MTCQIASSSLHNGRMDTIFRQQLNYLSSVQLELSNLCNLGLIHRKCFASCSERKEGKIILPAHIVREVLHELSAHGFDSTNKEIKFHEYNEPLNDPRLSLFIGYARELLPSTNIMLWTNGWYLDTNIGQELIEMGANRIRVTAYNNKEMERLHSIRTSLDKMLAEGRIRTPNDMPVYFRITRTEKLDDRMNMKNYTPLDLEEPCHALKGLSIRSDGQITLCCMDVYRDIYLGDLHKGFKHTICMNADKRDAIRKELEHGNRTLHLCRRCNMHRGSKTSVNKSWEGYRIGT